MADVLREVSDLSERQDIYCSVYANEISRHCEPSRGKNSRRKNDIQINFQKLLNKFVF